MRVKIGHHKQQIKKLLLIDGIARTGKTLLSKIIPSLKNFEQVEFCEFLEYILAGLHLKKIKYDYASSLIHQLLNEIGYNKLIGRKQNFRFKDLTSVKNFKNLKVYEKRLLKNEGNKIFNELKNTNNYFPLMTHDVMVNFSHFKKINLNCKMIQIYREPCDIIHSWYMRGFGYRWQVDPGTFDILTNYKNNLYPWYIAEKEHVWKKMNYVERCTKIVLDLINRSISNHKKNKSNKKILTITYENFLQETNYELKKICKFLNTSRTSFTDKILKKENCPAKYNYEKHIVKKKFIKRNINKKLFGDLEETSEKYKKLYNLLN